MPTWAGPLAGYGIASEALTLLRGASIVGALEPKMRRVPFRTKVPRETGPGTGGAWIGQGLVTPVTRTAYDMVHARGYKAGMIVVLSKELLKASDPDAERTIRETVVNGLASFLDQQFLLPTVTLARICGRRRSRMARPRSRTTGTSAAQINADLGALLAAVTTPGPRTWIMRAGTAARIAATIGGTAAMDVPRTLFGMPLILSANSAGPDHARRSEPDPLQRQRRDRAHAERAGRDSNGRCAGQSARGGDDHDLAVSDEPLGA